jgi:outer membrane biosynthesis protein TonB
MDDTGLTSEQLVLPMALLMKTDRLHFKRSGMHDMYVSKGKAPEKPDIPPPPPPEPTVAPEAAPPVQAPTVAPASGSAPQVGEPPSEPKRERQAEGPPKKKPEPTPRREKRVDEELEPTASVLMFGRRPKKEKKRRR